jgi:hypothetical protein
MKGLGPRKTKVGKFAAPSEPRVWPRQAMALTADVDPSLNALFPPLSCTYSLRCLRVFALSSMRVATDSLYVDRGGLRVATTTVTRSSSLSSRFRSGFHRHARAVVGDRLSDPTSCSRCFVRRMLSRVRCACGLDWRVMRPVSGERVQI